MNKRPHRLNTEKVNSKNCNNDDGNSGREEGKLQLATQFNLAVRPPSRICSISIVPPPTPPRRCPLPRILLTELRNQPQTAELSGPQPFSAELSRHRCCSAASCYSVSDRLWQFAEVLLRGNMTGTGISKLWPYITPGLINPTDAAAKAPCVQ